MTSNTPIKKELLVKVEPKELKEKIDELQRQRAKDGEVMKDLRKQLKDAQKDVREMKLLLDMFKTLPKEQRDKAQLMAAEKKVRICSKLSKDLFLTLRGHHLCSMWQAPSNSVILKY